MKEDTALPPFVALYGDLGVGKTAFVRGFASVLSPTSAVRSPTFALVNEYRGGARPLFHFDMYRIESEDDLYSIGFDDYLDRGICLTEWSENIPYALPEEYFRVTIEKTDAEHPDQRTITIERIERPC
jgi:tRNA threonylcarbamoyladenosine biosynthesis protein TsaE